jgi:radical SAM protein with 4Fe4S-binding SPASM domain
MKKIMEKIFDIGVPHIALTGGEPTMRDDFLDLIAHGEHLGITIGIITNGVKFADPQLVSSAIKNGLDYVQITIESHDIEIHNKMVGAENFDATVAAIRNFEKENIFMMTNTTLCKQNVSSIEETIRFLHQLKVKVFACNGLIYSGKGKTFPDALTEEEMHPIVERINALAHELGMRFIWYTPTQYCVFNPLEHGLGAKHCSAANTSIAIEPNWDVLPCQSYYEPVGNILKDEWKEIWNSPLFEKIRKKEFAEKKCQKCDLLQICGGGCPLMIDHQNAICTGGQF